MRVDRRGGIIRGVKILGLNSRNGRRYPVETLVRAVELYEGAKVNVNHAKGSSAGPRDYQDRMGAIRGVRVRPEEGLFADFHFNPKHALAEQLIWDAEHAPENVGFSHNVRATTVRRGEHVEVESIDKVQSVDLVADPATTGGLFESQTEQEAKQPLGEKQPGDAGDAGDAGDTVTEAIPARLSVESLRRDRPELVEQLLAESRSEQESLRREVAELRESVSTARRGLRIRELLAEFKLPHPDTSDDRGQAIIGPRFMRSLMEAADEESIRELIVERAELVRRLDRRDGSPGVEGKPLSRDQIRYEETFEDTDSFVKAIT